MLNELLLVERGAREAGLEMAERHPDVKDARRVPTLVVRLKAEGHVVSVQPLAKEVTAWSLRDGQHNSFPFVQKAPLAVATAQDEEVRGRALDKKAESGARRTALLELVSHGASGAATSLGWPGSGLVRRLQERRRELQALEGTPGASVLETIDRFVRAVEPSLGGDPHRLLREIAEGLIGELQYTAQDDWLQIALALFVGEQTPKGTWESTGALLFEAAQAELPIFDQRLVHLVSQALRQTDAGSAGVNELATCALTGLPGRLHSGPFPQPNLPVLGQTFLFARNPDIPAQGRYGRHGANALTAGADTVIRVAAAFEALTSSDRRGVTWQSIPGEAPKQSDLLVAFVDRALTAEAAGILTLDDEEEDFSEELATPEEAVADSVAVFEKRTQRVIDAVRAKVGADFRLSPVQIAVFRKVDPANRKVAYAGTASVAALYDAALHWAAGERNVPPWLTLPIFLKGERKPRPMAPPHLAPLGLIRFSKQLFLRHGQDRQEVVGMPAGEALALFLETVGEGARPARLRVDRVLRLVLRRRAALVTGAAHGLRRHKDSPGNLDFREALRTITVLGLLLHKLGRAKEEYMSDTAFKLGQLLAAADVVHAGYCADVRGGSLPPSLLGNQVFTMAQSNPDKALAALSRRWKPYEGWATKVMHDRSRADSLVASKNKDDQARGWDIKKAIRHAREMKSLAKELAASFTDCKVDDAFRAELLLGYIAGFPKAQKPESTTVNEIEDPIREED